MKKPLITKSVRNNAAFLTLLLFIGYLIFSFFSVIQINYYFTDNIDTRLKHEIVHIEYNLEILDNVIIIRSDKEFQEYDMLHETDNSFYLQIYNTKGELYFQSKNLKLFPGMPTPIRNFEEEFLLLDEKVNYKGLRVCYSKVYFGDEIVGYIQLATPKTSANSAIDDIIAFNLWTLPLAFILFVIVSLIFVKRSLNPINKIIAISQEITATNLSKRINYEADSDDELGRLKFTLNDLFDRLEFQINQISQFSDNASHQLMTPLTAISTELEYMLKKEHSSDEYRDTLKNVEEQTKEMVKIVKTLLILAKDCSICTDSRSVFSLSHLLKNEIKEAFKNNKVTISVDENIYLKGEADYFKMVLENLINNAIKYSSENDEVRVIVKEELDNTIISVYDNGIGIPDSEKTVVFERFYRGEKVESTGIKGHGLGLNLASNIVTKMGGKILIRDNEEKGTIFILEMPKLVLE
ncbi:MAG: HAMP domain-containing histidine kinase [Bacteroidetes bacterium]|nr:HAMP domain-containing histidine kinase [Bacteroidota bacterium]MBU1116253.1 HAMP domain-containing histidine kinase [Bacteroidota bacterium]MBU1799751.1 HAMP domain-containing histidine kinase [Bacteroidota bacterium]